MANLGAVGQRIIQGQVGAAGYSGDRTDPLTLQQAYDRLRAGDVDHRLAPFLGAEATAGVGQDAKKGQPPPTRRAGGG